MHAPKEDSETNFDVRLLAFALKYDTVPCISVTLVTPSSFLSRMRDTREIYHDFSVRVSHVNNVVCCLGLGVRQVKVVQNVLLDRTETA